MGTVMEIGQAPSWSSRDLEDKSSSSSSSSPPDTVARQTSILLVDIVWTILILGIFLGTAYLIKRSRAVYYTVSGTSSVQHVIIGNCKKRSGPSHHHNQLSNLEPNDMGEVDRGSRTSTSAAGNGRGIRSSGSTSSGSGADSLGHIQGNYNTAAAAASRRLDLEFSRSSSCCSNSSVDSNLSSFWSGHYIMHEHDRDLVDIIRLYSKPHQATKVASSSSLVGQSQSRLPAATASLTQHEFEVSPRASPSSHYHRGGHCRVLVLVDGSERLRELSRGVGGGGPEVEINLVNEELASCGSYEHGGLSSCAAAGGSCRRLRPRVDTSFDSQQHGEAAAAGLQMYYQEIHGHEVLEEKIQTEITMCDASTKCDSLRLNNRGPGPGAFPERDHHNPRSVEGDILEQLRQQQQHQPAAAAIATHCQSRVTTVDECPSRHASLLKEVTASNSIRAHEEPFPSRAAETANLKKAEESSRVLTVTVDIDNISRITQQLQSRAASFIDYGQFHFSDPDLNERWRPIQRL